MGILILIKRLIYEPAISSTTFLTQSVRSKYFDLLDHADERVAKEALNLIEKIGIHKGNEQYISMLHDRIDFDNDNIFNLYYMRAINNILEFAEYDNQLTDTYLKAIDLDNNYRYAALNGLRHSYDEKLKNSLLYLKDDPVEAIRKIAQKLHKKPWKFKKSTRVMIRGVQSVFNTIKYKGKPLTEEESSRKRQIRAAEDMVNRQERIRQYKLKI